MSDDLDRQLYDSKRKLHEISGLQNFHVEVFGDHIAKREKYKSHRGVDALHFYLVQKYRWLPEQVRSLSWDDLRFLFEEEMQSWRLPKEALPQSAASPDDGQLPSSLRTAATPPSAGADSRSKRQRVSPLKT